MIKEETKFENSDLMEGMTSISAVLNSPEWNDRRVEKVLIDENKRKSKAAEIAYLSGESEKRGFPIEFLPTEAVNERAIGSSHGGILALCTPRSYPALTPEAIRPNGFYAYLEGVEDPYNFGNAVRSLYAAGIDGIVLPPRNWMTAAGVVARSSAGTSELLPIFTAEPDELIEVFHKAGYQILCAGIRDSVSVYEEKFPYPVLLVVGGEKRGISRNILDQCDRIVRIDYGRSFRGSLTAAASAAVLAFEIYRQNRK